MSSDLPKVLYCSFDVIPEPTGTSARAMAFVRALSPAFNADGLTAKSPDHGHIERLSGMRLMRVPVGSGDLPARTQAFERAVRRQLESDEYQLVHFTDPYGGYALCELKSQYNYKLVYEVRGFPSIEIKYTHPHLEGDRKFLAKLRRQELFCLMNADHVVVGSTITAKMVESFGVAKDRITVVPPTVDLSEYPAEDLVPPDRVPMRVVYAGSQNSWQGLTTLLFAVSLAAKTTDIRLAIVGPRHPTWRLQLEEMVKHRKLTGKVEFIDAVAPEALWKVLVASDVGVVPLEKSERNTSQGAPVMKVAHYFAAGRPIVAADLPLLREITSPDCAVFHKPGEESELARRLIELANDPARRVEMGKAARAFAESKLSMRPARKGIVELYARLMNVPMPELEAEGASPQSVPEDAPTSMAMVPDEPPRLEATQNVPASAVRDISTDPHARLAPGGDTDPSARPAPEEPVTAGTDPVGKPPMAEEPPPSIPTAAPKPLGDALDSLFGAEPPTLPGAKPAAPEAPKFVVPPKLTPLAPTTPGNDPNVLWDWPRGPEAGMRELQELHRPARAAEARPELLVDSPRPSMPRPLTPPPGGPPVLLPVGQTPRPVFQPPGGPPVLVPKAPPVLQPALAPSPRQPSPVPFAPPVEPATAPVEAAPPTEPVEAPPAAPPPVQAAPPAAEKQVPVEAAPVVLPVPAPKPAAVTETIPAQALQAALATAATGHRTEPAFVSPAFAPPPVQSPTAPIPLTARAPDLPDPEEVSADDIEELPGAPPAAAAQPLALTVPLAGVPANTPSSGLNPPEEWLGHLLYGYAPFNVPVFHRSITGEIPTTPLQRKADDAPADARLKR